MDTARIADRQAREALAALVDEDITAVLEEEAMAAEVAYIDRLIEEVDRELVAQERTALVRVTHRFTDEVRARRAYRRAERDVLRTLPVLLPAVHQESEAA